MTKIITTKDKSTTLYTEKFDEHYHSTFGAINESLHIFINEGLLYSNLKTVNIFEVGFGTGLNAFLTYIQSQKSNITVNYICIEKFPIQKNIANQLNYPELLSPENKSIFNLFHECEWNKDIAINELFTFKKVLGDFTKYDFDNKYDIIYFDAFAPEKQPELWNLSIFQKVYTVLNNKGILTTYSSKGIVKNNLREAGFIVKRLKGPEGKRHILRAEKTEDEKF
ncbi:MAG: tRNA (5-methylaminomethyl-2-thiouridine)(34)-methyltransferase MnmD [Bacteroidales bacterium]|nr:tRNA (5-methylaminomethyl-2-thiouridine)(34)-methyltransferase MnmD [Bacteroidales bacterium]